MASLISLTLESVRMLSFLTVLGMGIVGTISLTGCDQPASDSVPTNPDPDAAEKSDIKIDAPGVDIDIDRTPGVDGKKDVDVDVAPNS